MGILDELAETTQTTEALRSRTGSADQEARGYAILKRVFIKVLIPVAIVSIFIPYLGMVFAVPAWFIAALSTHFVMKISSVTDFMIKTLPGGLGAAAAAAMTALFFLLLGAQPWASTIISIVCAYFTLLNFRRIIDAGKVARHVADQLNSV